ncbi:MAG: STAS domain-containing protein [Acidobacteria bacterium]|nr:STAS domain-containing protein [Acidobacteriota bacterium]
MPSSASPRRRLVWSLEIARRDRPDAHVLAAAGRIGTATAPAMAGALKEAIAAGHRRLLVDCSGVDYISGAGLAVIEQARAELHSAGGSLVLCGLREAVRVSFEVSGAGAGLDFADDVDQTSP